MKLNIGYLTLRRIESLKNVNDYLWGELSPHIAGQSILEVGSGIGTYTEYFLREGKDVVSVDIVPQIKDILLKRFSPSYKNFSAVTVDMSDVSAPEIIGRQFDTVICLNTLEHIEDDAAALCNMRKCLKKGGRLILQVPAHKFLYGALDKNLGHYRRYNFKEVKRLMEKSGFSVKGHFYLHLAGIAGWFLRSRLTGGSALAREDLQIYNSFLPFFKFLDRLFFRSVGQSLVVIGE